MNDLNAIMKPKSIALIGASTREHTIGSDILKRLLEFGFKGKIYPVNPKGGELQELKVYTSVLEIPDAVDLALIVINAAYVLKAIDECHEKKVGGLVVISAGFKEAGAEGVRLEAELKRKCDTYGLRCVGPNCLGVLNTHPAIQMDACFAESLPVRGNIGFVSQSGALGGGILNILEDLNLGFAQFISIGNQADVAAEDAIEYWENDADVKEILLYMESITNPERFRALATRVSRKKPILALKAGRSAAGARAASSHTGSLAGSDAAAEALFKQTGVIRETSLQTLFASAKAFATCPIPRGNRIAIITNSGGPGIMATDAICTQGMQIATLSEKTKKTLRGFLPASASVKNPVDMIASAPLEHYKKTLETVLADEAVDAVLAIYLPFLGLKDTDVAAALMEIKNAHPEKPVIGVFMTQSTFFTHLSALNPTMPFYMYAEEAVAALARLVEYRAWIDKKEGVIPTFDVRTNDVKAIFDVTRKENRAELTTRESINVLAAYGIRVCKSAFAHDEKEAIAHANAIGYPVVMKMTSKTTSHKTDVGGVYVNIKSDEELHIAYGTLIANLKAKNKLEGLEGVIVQEMVKGSRELVCGVATDPQYGPLIMFGLGGVYVEVMKDVAFRLAPLTDIDAKELVESMKTFALLKGVRGQIPAQIEKVMETLLRISAVVQDFPEIKELDINPLMIANAGGEPIAVDARITLKNDVQH